LKQKRNTISYDGYEDICEREGLTQQGRETLLGFLHDLGVVLNFRDHAPLENTQILNPAWVTNGVYQIINDKPLVKERQGVLDPPNLKRILSGKEYNRPALRAVITAMMNRFELSHTFLQNNHTCHLIPTLLPKDRPETDEWDDSLCFEYHYDVLPSSLIARLIVRLFTVVEVKRAWRNGVFLKHEDNEAQIVADYGDNAIRVMVRGYLHTRRVLLGILRAQMDAINNSIDLDVQQFVPIPGHPGKLEDYQYLLDLEQMGESSFVPRGVRQRIPVTPLLDGYESHEIRRKRRLPDMDRIGEDEPEEERIFISYAHADREEVLKIHQAIKQAGYDPWIDKYDIAVGEKWERAIEKAVKNCTLFVACISNNSFDRRGWIQREINYALEQLPALLPDDIFIIPLRLEDTKKTLPERLESLQALNYFEPDGSERLLKAIEEALKRRED
jgi:internalin A